MLPITRVVPCLLLAVALALPGCDRYGSSGKGATAPKITLPNADAIAKRLPDGVVLDSITMDIHGSEGTVAEELARLKATVKDKVLVDGRGREIRFYTPQEEGRAMRGEAKYRELIEKYTVVLLMPE